MQLEVRHLRIICAIAESGSLGKAAAAMRLSQPGLTAQLRRIEAMLGGELFERHASGVTPTHFGELVLTRARAVLPTMDELLRSTRVAAGTGRATAQRLRLGSINAPLLGGLIAALRSVFPDAEVTSRAEGSPLPLVEDIAAGRLEAAVVGDTPGYDLPPHADVVLRPIVTEPVFVLLPDKHPLAALDEVHLADLAEDDWALPHPDNDRTREYWATAFNRTGLPMHVPYEAEGRLVAEIVRCGHAISLCQPTFDEVPGVAVRPIAGDPLWYRHLLAWHRDGPLAGHGEVMARHAADAYAAASTRNPAYPRWLARRSP
ncbi:LysR family transcriptional regulator [Solihabitans fulvus]|uniref:LysR family transcriptional regulator n=1 Tax=Solihabitans fulvus TaxID=1892852 RepID=A0A5B2XE49_9PSEU|nr:LysR family transcriptional regulator [Solihabitans fulvus]KAA2261052.1 LysR family transcriptional regulator [Solihabitans fulvus]